jgi:hypothetical protein
MNGKFYAIFAIRENSIYMNNLEMLLHFCNDFYVNLFYNIIAVLATGVMVEVSIS